MGRNNRYKDWKNENSLFKRRLCCCRVVRPTTRTWPSSGWRYFLSFNLTDLLFIIYMFETTTQCSVGQNVYIKIHQTDISLSADKIFLVFIFYLISIYLFFYLNDFCCYVIKLKGKMWPTSFGLSTWPLGFKRGPDSFGVFPHLNLLV